MVQFVNLCLSIRKRFKEVFRDLEFIINGNEIINENILKQIQRKHYMAMEMVIRSNEFWKKYLFQFYIIFISLCVIMAYQSIFADCTILVRCALFIITIGVFLQLSQISFTAAALSIEAHRPYHIVYGISVNCNDIYVKNQV